MNDDENNNNNNNNNNNDNDNELRNQYKLKVSEELKKVPVHEETDWGQNRDVSHEYKSKRTSRYKWLPAEINILKTIYTKQTKDVTKSGSKRAEASHLNALLEIIHNPDYRKVFHHSHVKDYNSLASGYESLCKVHPITFCKQARPLQLSTIKKKLLEATDEKKRKEKEKKSEEKKKKNNSKGTRSSSRLSENKNNQSHISPINNINIDRLVPEKQNYFDDSDAEFEKEESDDQNNDDLENENEIEIEDAENENQIENEVEDDEEDEFTKTKFNKNNKKSKTKSGYKIGNRVVQYWNDHGWYEGFITEIITKYEIINYYKINIF